MAQIHPTVVVEPGANLAETVAIGPYCHIGSEVTLHEGVVLHAHVVVAGRTTVGANTRIFPFASIGHEPQDLKYAGEKSQLVIGRDNVIREHVTMNPGTEVGSNVVMANNATLAGHVVVSDFAILGGLSAVHQFVRIGQYAMIGGMSGIERDVIPYGSVMGDRARLSGVNIVGMQRRGFSRDEIQALRNAFQQLFGDSGTLSERVDDIAERFWDVKPVRDIIDFIRADSSRAICQPGERLKA